jgi:PAS domain S-box-containing protein
MGFIIGFKLDAQSVNSLKKTDNMPKVKNIETDQKLQEIIKEIEKDAREYDAVILGSKVKDPITIAQRLHFINKNISIIILCSPKNYHQMLDAMQFAPFLGEEVGCHSIEKLTELSAKIKTAVRNTRKRREYQDTITNMNLQIPGQSSIQLHTSRYVDRLLDSAPIGVALIDSNNKVIAWNKKSEQLFQKSERDVLGTSLLDLFPSDEKSRIIEFVNSNVDRVQNKDIFKRKIERNQQQLLEITLSHLDNDRKNKLIIFDDITERVSTEEALRKSEERFRTLADNIPNLAWMANPDGYIYWYNSRWYEYTGTKPADMEGWGWRSIQDPKILPVVLKQWKESIESGKPFDMVVPLKGAEGVFRPFLTRVVPIFDENGKIIQWFGTNTDITEQKQLERQKDDFLGIASHELKTPVTSIKAYGQVLQTMFQRKGDTKAVEHLSKMDAQVNKLTALISDLLDVTKIQSGRMEFYEDYFDFNELVNEQVEQLQLTTEKHAIQKELNNTRSVYGDRERIGQVITNLISNAIKYSPHNEKIIVKTTSDRNQITLCVRDFGVGIPSDKLDRVFEQFYRVSGPKEITFPGLGLGLYVSSEIIKREGGKIWVESTEGKGSTFCFTLPLNGKAKKQQKNSLKELEVQHE